MLKSTLTFVFGMAISFSALILAMKNVNEAVTVCVLIAGYGIIICSVLSVRRL